jgi:hypothetical protein
MSKGVNVTSYILFFVSSAIIILVILYAMIYGGFGVAKSLTFYDANTIVESLASDTSAVASFQGNFHTGLIYKGALPSGVCDLTVQDNKISMSIPEQLVPRLSSQESNSLKVPVKATQSTMEIPVPNYVQIKPFTATCKNGVSKSILIQKQGDQIWFSTA